MLKELLNKANALFKIDKYLAFNFSNFLQILQNNIKNIDENKAKINNNTKDKEKIYFG